MLKLQNFNKTKQVSLSLYVTHWQEFLFCRKMGFFYPGNWRHQHAKRVCSDLVQQQIRWVKPLFEFIFSITYRQWFSKGIPASSSYCSSTVMFWAYLGMLMDWGQCRGLIAFSSGMHTTRICSCSTRKKTYRKMSEDKLNQRRNTADKKEICATYLKVFKRCMKAGIQWIL